MTTTTTPTTTPTKCFLCGGDLVHVQEKAEIQIGHRTALVSVSRSRCTKCDESFYTPDEMDAAQMAATEILRREDNLLGPAEIRAIRAQYDLTQAQLEKLLGVGAKTVVRWERGTVFQSRSTDVLLRLIHDLPAVFEHLATRHGIHWSKCEQLKPQHTWRYVDHSSEVKPRRRSAEGRPFSAPREVRQVVMKIGREATTIRPKDIPVEVLR